MCNFKGVYKILSLIKVRKFFLGEFHSLIRNFIKITSRSAKHIWPFSSYSIVYLNRFFFLLLQCYQDWAHPSFYKLHYHLLSHYNYHLTVTQPQKFKSHLLPTPELRIAEAPISRFQDLNGIINQCFHIAFIDCKSRFQSTVCDIINAQ